MAAKKTILDVAMMIRAYDWGTYQHCMSTAKLVSRITKEEYMMDPFDAWILFCAAEVHDIGKIFIPKNILLKEGPLSQEERAIMDHHAMYGYSFLKRNGFDDLLCEIVALHHGVSKCHCAFSEKSLELAGILRACDIYDAVTHKRPYHEAASHESAMEILHVQAEPIADKIISAVEDVMIA